jgi:hypothetical protein
VTPCALRRPQLVIRRAGALSGRLEADTAEASSLQRPLANDALRVVAKGEKDDRLLRVAYSPERRSERANR